MQAELVHARFAMAGVAGILFTDVSSVVVCPLMTVRNGKIGGSAGLGNVSIHGGIYV